MKKSLIVFAIVSLPCLISETAFSQQQGSNAGQGGQGAGGGFGGGDGQFGGTRVGAREDIVDNRAATNLGENNTALGGQQGAANNMNFLNALFGGAGASQPTNQGTALRGRGVRAPLRLGFQFTSTDLKSGQQTLNARIVRIPRFKDRNIKGVVNNKTLVLVGEVNSQQEADLITRIARFEPGVDQVQNQLKVVEQIE